MLCLNVALLGAETRVPPTKAQGRPRATRARGCLQREQQQSGPGVGGGDTGYVREQIPGLALPQRAQEPDLCPATASSPVKGLSVSPGGSIGCRPQDSPQSAFK